MASCYIISLILISLLCADTSGQIIRRTKNIHNIPSRNPDASPFLTKLGDLSHLYDHQKNILNIPMKVKHLRKNNLAKLKESVLNKENPKEISLLKEDAFDSPQITSNNLQHSLLQFRQIDSQFVIPIAIGNPPQIIDCVMDTGSSTLWVISSECTTPSCKIGQIYDPNNSSSVERESQYVEVKFAGARISGQIVKDQVTMGSYAVDQQTFGIIQNQQGSCFETGNFSGILGFGFPKLADQSTQSLFDGIVKQYKLKQNMFSFYAPGHLNEGQLSIGGVDQSKFEGEMKFYKVLEEYYWGIKITEVRYNNKRIDDCSDSNPCNGVFDTGTNVLTFPSSIKSKFDELATVEACKNRQIGTLDYYFENGDKYTLEPHDFFDVEVDCFSLVSKVDIKRSVGNVFLIGAPVFQKYYVAFDRDNSRIGIANYKK